MLENFHGMDSPYNTGMLGGSLLQSVPLDSVLTFLGAIKWTKVDEARPWSPGGSVLTDVVEAQQVKIDQVTPINSSNYPEALLSTLVSSELDPLKFGRMGISYNINYDQHDATVRGVGANSAGHWRYLAALASLWTKLDSLVIEGNASNTNEFNGLKLLGSNTFASSGTSAANTRSDIAKIIANAASAGQGGTALVGNDQAQRLLTDAYDGGRTEYGPGPLGGLIPFFDKVPFLRASVATNGSNLTDIYCVNLASIVMFYTSGSRDTLGFNHRSNDRTGTVPLSAATEHIVYGGHALNVTNESAVQYVNSVNVASYT